ncbi:tyrosine-protein phosphatase [Demequina mangrovi]|uniref:Protein tyrosine/serine phosphatase n=1 Tax=Demequina mangrovi TaxID=1043493 RepID=A0A1H7B042_9MICO|nr:tyrosine-protein phosphatase [Demequina mangrovi]SEJ71193.1 Protein tyrosine/serine phosphatase [Demequina mangrovi]
MHHEPALTWAFNARPVVTIGAKRVYRSAAPEFRAPELTEPPTDVCWIDLRSAHERIDAAWLGEGWTRVHIDLVPGAAAVKPGTRAYEITEIDFGAMYVQMVDRAQQGFARVITAIAEAETDVLVACAGGRDRTGLVSAMLRELAGHPRDVILEDYRRTNDQGAGLSKALVEVGLVSAETIGRRDFEVKTEDLALALEAIDAKGGVRRYLEDGGASAAALDLLGSTIVSTS